MRALLILILLLPLQAAAQLAEAPLIPQFRVTATPATTVQTQGYVQGQIILRIQLISRHPFEALAVTPPLIENAETVQLARPRTRRISGYAGEGHVHERLIAVFPKQAGLLRIPAATAVGVVEPVKDQELAFDIASQPIEIAIAAPPATYDVDWWLAATRVEIDESWSQPVEALRVDQPAQRKVSLRVWGVADERLPDLTHPPAQGVKISLRSAEQRTETSSEGLIAYADYVWDIEVERQQVVFLKPIGVTFWNTISHRRQSVAAPGHRLEPLPADAAGLADSLMKEAAAARDSSTTWAITAALALSAPLLAAFAALLFAAAPTRADRRLWRDCGGAAGPDVLYSAVEAWRAASGLDRNEMRGRLPVRHSLSDQLFSRTHPPADVGRKLRRQALAWSRSVRVANLASRILRSS